METAKPLRVINLEKHYGHVKAVRGVTFEVEHGEIFGLLGPNGAGKTSIISTIVTLEKPTSGQVEVFGFDVEKAARPAKLRMGVVPQELINHGYFDVEEIMTFHSGYYGIRDNQAHIEFLLKRLQLWDQRHKKVRQLSGGMKRRLIIAKALVHKPNLLLLDEPTAGVDIELRQNLWEFVRELKAQGISVLLTTHYLEEAEKLCDRVAIIHRGQISRMGPTASLVRELTQRKIRFRLKTALGEIRHPYLTSQSRDTLEFRVPANMGIGDLLLDLNLDLRFISDLQIQEGTLEDAFLNVLGVAG